MYDFAHTISDALEGITHSLCTLEFEDHRPLYEWILDNLPKQSAIAIETRILLLSPEGYRTTHFPRLISDHLTKEPREYADFVKDGFQYFVASSQAYGGVMDEPHKRSDEYAAYMRLFEQSVELVRFTPSAQHPGPELRIFKLK